MPPRPARHTARYASREPEETGGTQTSLVKPQLPNLRGTPSSRRQYTYGAAVEPPPRIGAGLQRMDLQSAVGKALAKHPDEDEEFVRPAIPKQTAAKADRGTTKKDNAARQAATTVTGHLAVDRDDDSSRSFGLESEYYDNATIGTAPPKPLAPEKRQAARKPRFEPQEEESSDDDSLPSRHENEPRSSARVIQNFDEIDAARHTSAQSRSRSHGASARPVDNPETQKDAADAAKQSSKQSSRSRSQRASSKQTEDLETQPDAAETARQTNKQSSRSRTQQNILARLNENGGTQQSSKSTTWATQKPLEAEAQAEAGARSTHNDRSSNGRKSLFRKATGSGTDALNRARQIPSDPQQRDWEIQREISAAEAENNRIRTMVERMAADPWYFEWMRFRGWLRFIFWPPYWFGRGGGDPFDFTFNDDIDESEESPTEWGRLFNPMTYLLVLKRWFDGIMDRVFRFIDRLSGIQIGQVQRSFAERIAWAVALIGFAFFLLMGSGALHHIPEIPDIDYLKPSVSWPSTDGFSFGNIIPSVPTVSWPSWPSWSRDSDDLPFYDPFAMDDVVIPDDHKRALDALKNQAEIHKKALKRLETILPRIVHMDLVKGRPSIKPEFWHALQDHLRESGSFLNLDNKRGNYEISSEQQWKAIVARLGKDPTFKGKLDGIVGNAIQDRLPNFWDTWFRNNNAVLEPLVEKAMAKKQTAGSGAAFDQKLSKIVSDQLRKQNQTAVSRDDFLAHLRDDLTKHESQVQAEFSRLKSDMDNHIKESIRTAKMMAPQTMSNTEMKQLIRKIVHQTLTDVSLTAVAKSKIHAHWHSDLKYQVNFFGIGAGATMETHYTAPDWNPYTARTTEKDALALGLTGIHPRPRIEVLLPWQEEGDRWCGSHAVDSDGRPHGVGVSIHLGHLVIPENIAVEHIHPNATLDPDARPRHIEVFAKFEFKEEQELVRDYSSNKFPENINGWNFNPSPLPDSFVKITQFEYQGDELNEGVHVHHINDEFANLGIPTDHVIIRAMSNYGAPDHTCFYRVRLFGRPVDELS
ncbi:unnamed protein product [Fusarium graminearum]|uniref:Chromosome 3, complete genome n=2 Tax=Gibberella zeae (strain ATCC MYA-4620 / CBS 123657 / FGSC 9075 / NRRL 31084 / PH-1) TaxID=229533 RepID=A0A098E1H5_GIBZE|nr:unnamed protein product [Fusarium graminearum]CAF3579678.1 unnamed protein product [Fusarium graminearum]CAG1991673.1 unnamed protein product [Fusarium graminearum]CAG1999416.1 unnamed protein product [Fusarium graminearum]CEF87940.1 unnamed protein product [Fusarium graminearum]